MKRRAGTHRPVTVFAVAVLPLVGWVLVHNMIGYACDENEFCRALREVDCFLLATMPLAITVGVFVAPLLSLALLALAGTFDADAPGDRRSELGAASLRREAAWWLLAAVLLLGSAYPIMALVPTGFSVSVACVGWAGFVAHTMAISRTYLCHSRLTSQGERALAPRTVLWIALPLEVACLVLSVVFLAVLLAWHAWGQR